MEQVMAAQNKNGMSHCFKPESPSRMRVMNKRFEATMQEYIFIPVVWRMQPRLPRQRVSWTPAKP
jgi:hypothetical protein